MKVVCTIGSQGLSDGRRFVRGDVYEVDDETASTLILNRNAEEYVATEEVVVEEVVVEEVVKDETVAKTSPTQKKTKKNKR